MKNKKKTLKGFWEELLLKIPFKITRKSCFWKQNVIA